MTASKNKYFILGIVFTLIIAIISLTLSKVPILDKVGALTIAILIAILYRHFKGYPEKYRTGIEFSSKRLLKLAIVLYGLKLNINEIITKGGTLLLVDIGVVIFSLTGIYFLNKWIKGDKNLGILLGIGTGICGAAAIAATSSILKSREKDVAISIGIIALIGTIFSLGYTVIDSFLHLTPQLYGAWAGTSLHEIAHVVLAADFSRDKALSIALLGKLGRVFLLIPVSIILIIIMKFRSKNRYESQKIDIPYFLIGFVIMAIIHTYIVIPQTLMYVLDFITNLFMMMAMVALGLNVSFKDLKNRAFKPLIAVIVISLCLSSLIFLILNSIY
ncbi:putative sulfate exporter family transporter [Staphylococcus condimenti]|uniref:Sulfate exporter family transporter n=2 Tax=Staphylococcus condimenti TaxID=70255 RepID=A0A143P9F7_9STAP|nr:MULTISPECIES: YeiH family protein [Staphylococcus]AMY04913.1 hypothetical protein A4G25_02800 [Staphylococcus condimenti]APR61157.1 hypothetical protein BTZ13_08055 [Staphylococcus condimenti]MDK8645009.1 YeiH family protein [Staphylococcus condimenti]OFP01139.1 hypothetical protein HMPREF3007_10325 [Staphylococcus sp. HMSC065E08]PNZ56914.1 putative sulfate exporter family transporter [Staphylococcus condimenti]